MATLSSWVQQNPVGTGPYRLKEWRRGQKIVLEANPGFREVIFPDSKDPADREIVAKNKGARLPRIGRVEITIIEESQPRLLAFEKGDLDYVEVPRDLVWNVLGKDNKLLPRFAAAGVALARGVQPTITFTYFNMEDPVVGGYTKDKVALRRAIGMAYNVEEEVRVLRQGQAMPATQVIPPNVTGHDPNFSGHTKFDPAGAKALLDKFGYVDRDKDGWRDLPDGKPLVLKMGTSPSALDRQYNELWQRNLNAVGIKIEFVNQKFGDLLKMARAGPAADVGAGEHELDAGGLPVPGTPLWRASRDCRTWGGSSSRTSTACTTCRAASPTARSAPSTSAKCRRSSPRIRRGCSTRSGSRASPCIRG